MSESWEVRARREAVERFAVEVVGCLVGTEGRDGDLTSVKSVMFSADELGIVASANPGSAGYEYGIWGTETLSGDIGPSLEALAIVASRCAGIAMGLHVAGLAARALVAARRQTCERAAIALLEPPFGLGDWTGPPQGPLDGLNARVSARDGELRLRATKTFVYAVPDTVNLLVICRDDSGEHVGVLVDREASGITRVAAEERTGLAACEVLSVALEDAFIAPAARLPAIDAAELLALYWLGVAAIAVGNAVGARRRARAYASERVQAGVPIARHPAVQLLLGDADLAIEAAAATVAQAAAARGKGIDMLRRAALARAIAADNAAHAVTGCLQVLGGYGYMEEYRLEKHLRDAVCLRSVGGRRDDLARFVAMSGGEESWRSRQ
ncbi:MAG: acyl-CoA/acyl-ACP dehydrogenase [Candidatus Schekmanbacteria bacterium]|nr:acyl-CoA/acyl-ACP dehydrogenase [Candidatus Schekmanbacteria bacterium]